MQQAAPGCVQPLPADRKRSGRRAGDGEQLADRQRHAAVLRGDHGPGREARRPAAAGDDPGAHRQGHAEQHRRVRHGAGPARLGPLQPQPAGQHLSRSPTPSRPRLPRASSRTRSSRSSAATNTPGYNFNNQELGNCGGHQRAGQPAAGRRPGALQFQPGPHRPDARLRRPGPLGQQRVGQRADPRPAANRSAWTCSAGRRS